MSTAEQKMGRAWPVVGIAAIVVCIGFVGAVVWIAWAILNAVGLL